MTSKSGEEKKVQLKVISSDDSGLMKFAAGDILSVDSKVMERLIRAALVMRGSEVATSKHSEQNIITYTKSLRRKDNDG